VNDPTDDKALDEYLKGGSAVSRRYRELGADPVPTDVDRLVLERAHAAVTRPSRSQAWRRWSVPVALAASVVLAVAILLETGGRQDTSLVTSQEPASTGVAPAASEFERKSEIARDESRADKLQSRSVPPASQREVVVQIAPVVPDVALEVPFAPAPSEVSVTAKRAVEAAAPAPVAAAPILADEPQRELQALQNQAPPEYNSSPSSNAAVQATAAQADTAQAPTAKARTRDDAGANDLSEVTVTGARRNFPSAAAGAGPRNTVPRTASYADGEEVAEDSAAAAAQPGSYTDPERWLEAIRQLRKDGKAREADLEWKRFRAAFPDHQVAESDTARPQR
jgi:hypothetical protein